MTAIVVATSLMENHTPRWTHYPGRAGIYWCVSTVDEDDLMNSLLFEGFPVLITADGKNMDERGLIINLLDTAVFYGPISVPQLLNRFVQSSPRKHLHGLRKFLGLKTAE